MGISVYKKRERTIVTGKLCSRDEVAVVERKVKGAVECRGNSRRNDDPNIIKTN